MVPNQRIMLYVCTALHKSVIPKLAVENKEESGYKSQCIYLWVTQGSKKHGILSVMITTLEDLANFVLHVLNSILVMLTQEHCQGEVGSLPLNIDFPSISQLQQNLF